MTDPHFTILYVASPAASETFYRRLLARAPVESSSTFVMFPLGPGSMLGLWGADGVVPAPGAPGGSELAFTVGSGAEVDRLHAEWAAQGICILQSPAPMDFGRTFTAADPDGHRLRVFAPAAG